MSYFYLRLQAGKAEDPVISHLEQELQMGRYGIHIVSLDAADANTLTADLTLFLVSYLASGLLFGALSIGVIVSRAVVERRQQIGMMRALGFTRGHILGVFIIEASFLISAGLATWLAAQVAHQLYQRFPFPLGVIALIFLGSYFIALVCVAGPSRQASRIPPAEALRYE